MNIEFTHYYECPPDWYWIPRNNNWRGYHLWLVVKGEGMVRKENTFYKLEPGACLLYRMQDNYIVTQEKDNPIAVYGINISGIEEADKLPEYVLLEDYTLLKSLMSRIVDLYTYVSPLPVEATVMLRAALCEYGLNADLKYRSPVYPDPQINSFVQQVRKDAGCKYTITEIAETLNCSRNQCIRRIKKTTGLTPIQLVNRIKIDIAKQHLLATSYQIYEIAEILGFCDMYYFSKVFKRITGISPSSFRSNRR